MRIIETGETHDNPFPGLRPFEYEDRELFFGREELSEELLNRLKKARFLAVIGKSGSGKSSLVRAGLLPALVGGFLSGVGSAWRVAVLRPGTSPVEELVRALKDSNVLGLPDASAFGLNIDENEVARRTVIKKTLGRGSRGLVEIVRQAELKERDENLLIVVDQFEELFRYTHGSSKSPSVERAPVSASKSKPGSEPGASNNGKGLQPAEDEKSEDEATAFVERLLEATRQEKLPIFVVITMRSEYLGDCAQFQGLPEAINEGQYLVPRLTPDQQRKAIIAPIKVCESEITPRLVNQLLRDIGTDDDQLPLLQHALMRTWEKAVPDSNRRKLLDLADYVAIGGMAEALSMHAEDAYNELSDEHKKVAEKLFKCLTDTNPEGKERRRATPLKDICEIIDEKEADIIHVIEVFRRSERCFLMPPGPQIDISHECLIRHWARLKKWVEEESESARTYRELVDAALRHEEGKRGLLDDQEAYRAFKWRENNNPNAAWAQLYHVVDFQVVHDFLEKSKKELDRKEAEKQAQLAAKKAQEEKERAAKQAQREKELADKEAQRRKELAEKEARNREKIRQKYIRIRRAILSVAGFLLVVVSAIAMRQCSEATQQRITAEQQRTTAEHRSYAAQMALAQISYNQGDYATANEKLNWLRSYIESDLNKELKDVAGFEWYYLWRLSHNEKGTLRGHADKPVYSVAYSNDGRIIATGGGDGTVKLWDGNSSREINVSPGVAVRSIAFSPVDEKILATGSEDGSVKLWDWNALKEQISLLPSGRQGKIFSVAFSHDGAMLAAGGEGQTVNLWRWKEPGRSSTITVQTSLDRPVFVNSIAFSPDEKVLAIGINGGVQLWDISNYERPENKTPKDFLTELGVLSVAFSPNGKILAIGSNNNKVRLWDRSTSEMFALPGHFKDVSAVVFSTGGDRLATGSYDGSVMLWDTSGVGLIRLEKGTKINPSETEVNPSETKVNQQNQFLSLKPILKGHSSYIYSIAFSLKKGAETLVSGSADGTAKKWSTAETWGDINGPPLVEGVYLEAGAGPVLSLAFSLQGTMLVTGSADKRLKLFSIEKLRSELRLPEDRNPINLQNLFSEYDEVRYSDAVASAVVPAVASVAVSGKENQILAAGNWDGSIRLWDLSRGQKLKDMELSPLQQANSDGRILSVSFSKDGNMLAANSDQGKVKVWQLEPRGALSDSIKGFSVAFSPTEENLLATGEADGKVKLWNARTGGLLTTLEGNETIHGHEKQVLSVAFSPNGKMLATGSADNTVILWDVDKRKPLVQLKGHSDAISSLAFSSNGDRLATGSYDGSVKLWDTSYQIWGSSPPPELITLKTLSTVISLAFSPDNRALVAGGTGKYLWLWRAAAPEDVEQSKQN